MRLKQLHMQGYKTFANRTELVFDSGITAVVGPNGSGKSNIADAIRWVLGEQSFSELRGKRTTDMIFSGSQSRPQAGMASATMVLDNSDGWLPIDYNEVEINRRAYRSGENEYYLNGNKVRLKDIRELLATSGLAKRTYTIIGQGLIDRALSLKAEERRALFEEAAGIQHYKTRRAEALRRLHETQRNIERVQDVLGELEPRLRSLKRQAQRAQDYEVVQADLRHLLRIWYGFQWENQRKRLSTLKSSSAETEEKWKVTRREIALLQTAIEEARENLGRVATQISSKSTSYDDLREKFEQSRRNVAILTERQESISRQLKETETELPDLRSQVSRAETEYKTAEADLTAAQADIASERAMLERFESNVDGPQAEIVTVQKTAQNLETEVAGARQKLSQADGVLSQLKERLAGFGVDDRPQTTDDNADIESKRSELAVLQEKLEALQKERATQNDERKELITALKTLRNDHREKDRASTTSSKALARLEERVAMLDQMRTSAETKTTTTILNTLTDILTIPPAYQTQLAVALENWLDTLIVENEDALNTLLSEAESTVALVPDFARSQPAVSPENLTSALDVCTFSPGHKPLVSAVIGHIFLAETDGIVDADLPHGAVAVTPDGTLYHANGIVEKRVPSAQNALRREEAWREASAEVERKKAEVLETETALAELAADIEQKQAQADALTAQERDQNASESQLRQQINSLARDVDRLDQAQRFRKNQAEQRAREHAKLRERIDSLTNERATYDQQLRTAESRLETARLKLETLPVSEVRQQKAQLQQGIATARTIVEGRRAVVDSRNATLVQMKSRFERLESRASRLREEQAEIDLTTAQAELDRYSGEMKALSQELAPLRESRTKAQADLTDKESDLIARQKAGQSTDQAYNDARLALGNQENRIENLKERITADLGFVMLNTQATDDEGVQQPLPLAEVVGRLPQVDELPDGIEASIQKRRGQMQRMGAINPDAPKEYEEASERVDFLHEQIEDLRETEETLRGVIAELDTLTSQEFGKTVERVNEIFTRIFTQLFGGGSADLILTNPDDLTVSGVDIMAQLPGKRKQGLGLLSGGERALTGAALIFSLLTVSPPPFCVMDEVDAALDEANINRFREALQELAKTTQFIMITHNRGTVRAAETIYGISMGGDSVSQIISIKPEDYVTAED